MSINWYFVIVTMAVIEPPRSFPRDSSASLGMTENKKAGMTENKMLGMTENKTLGKIVKKCSE